MHNQSMHKGGAGGGGGGICDVWEVSVQVYKIYHITWFESTI